MNKDFEILTHSKNRFVKQKIHIKRKSFVYKKMFSEFHNSTFLKFIAKENIQQQLII